MLIFLYLLFCTKLLAVLSWKPTADYCKVKCPHHEKDAHTACKCKMVPPRKEITNDIVKFREEMVDSHNKRRNEVASGKLEKFPKATNMRALSYDLELEYIARCYAGVIKKGHDVCRKMASKSMSNAGQNLAGTSDPATLKNEPEYLVNLWYLESNDVEESKINEFITKWSRADYRKSPDKKVGHLSQMLWWSHKFVGCARVDNKDNEKKWQYILICNYAGASKFADTANLNNHPVYATGDTPCSQCADGEKCNSKYPALCGEIAAIPKDELSPLEEGSSSRSSRINQHNLLIVVVFLSVLFSGSPSLNSFS